MKLRQQPIAHGRDISRDARRHATHGVKGPVERGQHRTRHVEAGGRSVSSAIFLGVLLYGVVYAQEMQVYTGVLDIDAEGEQVAIPVKIAASESRNGGEKLKIEVTASISEVLGRSGSILEQEVRQQHKGCRERWSAWNGTASISHNAIYLSVTARVEKWACEEIFGEELKTRLAQETGKVNAYIRPRIVDGQIQLTLDRFEIKDLSDISKLAGVESTVRQSVIKVLTKFNNNTEKTRLPSELHELGFRYLSIRLSDGSREPTAIVSIIGPNKPLAFFGKLMAVLGSNNAE